MPLSRYGILLFSCGYPVLLLQEGLALADWLGEPHSLTHKTVSNTFLCCYPHSITVWMPVLNHTLHPCIGTSRDPDLISNDNIG